MNSQGKLQYGSVSAGAHVRVRGSGDMVLSPRGRSDESKLTECHNGFPFTLLSALTLALLFLLSPPNSWDDPTSSDSCLKTLSCLICYPHTHLFFSPHASHLGPPSHSFCPSPCLTYMSNVKCQKRLHPLLIEVCPSSEASFVPGLKHSSTSQVAHLSRPTIDVPRTKSKAFH